MVSRQGHQYLAMAADTLGAIGEKPGDQLCVPPEIGGRMTTHVCLIETLAVGAPPVAPAGIRAELTECRKGMR